MRASMTHKKLPSAQKQSSYTKAQNSESVFGSQVQLRQIVNAYNAGGSKSPYPNADTDQAKTCGKIIAWVDLHTSELAVKNKNTFEVHKTTVLLRKRSRNSDGTASCMFPQKKTQQK